MVKYTILLLMLLGIGQSIHSQEDSYLWLEEVEGSKALEFVQAQNKATFDKLSLEKDYQSIYDKSLEIYNSDERIAYPDIKGDYVYNFWQDKEHVRGIWRRCLLADYKQDKFNWETLIDLDEMSKKDDIKWVFKGANGLYPSYNRFLVQLSRGGGDAVLSGSLMLTRRNLWKTGFKWMKQKGMQLTWMKIY